MRHLAAVPYFDFLSYAFRDELFENYSKDKVMPLFKKGANGVYVVSDLVLMMRSFTQSNGCRDPMSSDGT